MTKMNFKLIALNQVTVLAEAARQELCLATLHSSENAHIFEVEAVIPIVHPLNLFPVSISFLPLFRVVYGIRYTVIYGIITHSTS